MKNLFIEFKDGSRYAYIIKNLSLKDGTLYFETDKVIFYFSLSQIDNFSITLGYGKE